MLQWHRRLIFLITALSLIAALTGRGSFGGFSFNW